MGAAPLVIELLTVFVLTVFLLHKYGDWRRQHVVVTISTLIAWYFSFIIAFILPLDVALAFYRQCVSRSEHDNSTLSNNSDIVSDSLVDIAANTAASSGCSEPKSYVPDDVLPQMWRFVYFTTEILTWIVLPIMQSYSRAGDFTATGKLITAMKFNAIYYGSYLLLLGLMMIYVALKGFSLNPANLKVIAITASNTWGLFWLVLLLGYGLVEVPRKIWQASVRGYSLNRLYFDIEKLSLERSDAEDALRTCFEEAQGFVNNIKDSHPQSGNARLIMTRFSESLVQQYCKKQSTEPSDYHVNDAANLPDEKTLIRLHKRVIESLNNHQRVQAQWGDLVERALYREDVQRNMTNANRKFVRSIPDRRPAYITYVYNPTVEWYWECFLQRYFLKTVGASFALASICVVWSEVTFFSREPVLSFSALIVGLAARRSDYAFIEFFSILSIAYLCMCAYYTVFKLKVYRYYHLDPHHHTNENSLLFSAILLSRLTPPLCLNFLGLIHLDSHVAADSGSVETAYTAVMGHLDVVWIIAKGFNIYFPMAILLLCLGTYFRLGTKLLHFIGIDQFMESDDLTADMVQAGKALIATERNRIQREINRDARSEFWQGRLPSHDIRRPLRNNQNPCSTTTTPTSGFVPVDFNDKAGIVQNSADTDEWGAFGTSDRIDSNQQQSDSSFGRRYGATQPGKGIFDDL